MPVRYICDVCGKEATKIVEIPYEGLYAYTDDPDQLWMDVESTKDGTVLCFCGSKYIGDAPRTRISSECRKLYYDRLKVT